MKLPTQVNLIVASLSAAFMITVALLEFDSTRRSVHEEIAAANVVATQLLSRVADIYEHAGDRPLLAFLQQLGRVRAHEITLLAANGTVIYRSPPSPYKQGRDAPRWFSVLFLPQAPVHSFVLADGAKLIVEANASRAILDGWDSLKELLGYGVLAFAVLNGLVFWLVGRAVAPWALIARGLARIEQGDLTHRLPDLRGYEAGAIARAFNRMVLAVDEKLAAERKALQAETLLDERRELDGLIEQRLDEERRAIARELHDEFAQSVTAIRSLAVAISSQNGAESRSGQAAQLIAVEAAHLSDAMHGLIPRLAPLALDTLGLAEALEGFIAEWRHRYPELSFTLRHDLSGELGTSITLAIHRVVQEAVINAVRHAQPSRIDIQVTRTDRQVRITVADDGVGLPENWSRAGRFGLRGLGERLAKLGGELQFNNRMPSGVEVIANIPLSAQ